MEPERTRHREGTDRVRCLPSWLALSLRVAPLAYIGGDDGSSKRCLRSRMHFRLTRRRFKLARLLFSLVQCAVCVQAILVPAVCLLVCVCVCVLSLTL